MPATRALQRTDTSRSPKIDPESAGQALDSHARILTPSTNLPEPLPAFVVWNGDVADFLKALPRRPIFDLIVSSPPYNLGKSYERRAALDEYLRWQENVIDELIPRLKETGSLCWQVGNFVDNGQIIPLDIEFAAIFKKHGLQLRNRIIWHFGHGLHNKRRFSGRYETVMWYSKTDDYIFNLDDVRIPAKYPGKRHFKGPNKGKVSGNPLGKNPEDVWSDPNDVWNIPNVKNNHIEKTSHPCQFPVGLIERLVLATRARGLHSRVMQETGRMGERLSIEYETNRTGEEPTWQSVESNLVGYDLLSCVAAEDSRKLPIEVKASISHIENASFHVTRNEWETGITAEFYAFHLWALGEKNPALAVLDRATVTPHIPSDSGAGTWESVDIPFRVFAASFSEQSKLFPVSTM